MSTKLTVALWLLLGAFACGQSRTITGTVTDATTRTPLPGVSVLLKGTKNGATTDAAGYYKLAVSGLKPVVLFSYIGFITKELAVGQDSVLNITLQPDTRSLNETIVTGYDTRRRLAKTEASPSGQRLSQPYAVSPSPMIIAQEHNTEDYSPLREDGFREVRKHPVTTFSADVDRAAYSNVRRFLNQGQLPPKDAVRIEEMVNYFRYNYPQPTGKDPVSMTTELSESPWNPGLQLLRIGVQARTIPTDNLPPSNLVFLIDVSGSMSSHNKLPLVKSAINMLVDQLRPSDRLSIVVYAGSAGLVLPPTPGNQPQRIRDAINQLEAGGSTAGGAGIQLAYKVARDHFQKGGNNRVILATDGDFNVGVSSDGGLERLIEQERKSGVFLSVLGFGMGNYKDNKLETLADKGNGNYAYIDNAQEAHKVFVQEFGGTLFTVAKDVKLQVEFNPRYVQAYRLIGYENRRLNNEDFNNDQKDAGDLGSGHTVTALYELVPTGINSTYLPSQDSLKYQRLRDNAIAATSNELLTLKVRYKQVEDSTSRLLTFPVKRQSVPLAEASADFRFAAAVTGFGLLLRDSQFKGKATYEQVIGLARPAAAADTEGYRQEFVRLVETTRSLQQQQGVTAKKE